MISKNTFIICFVLVILCQQSICGKAHLRREPFELAHQQYLMHENQHLRSSNSIGGSVVGFILSPVLFIMSFIMIWNNERKAAIDQRRVELAQKLVKTINPSNFEQIRQSDGQLVHVSGKTETNQAVFDNETGISINNAIKIKREVQVREYRSRGSDDNKTYQLQWVSSNVQSAGDGHSNDASNWFIKTQITKNSNVMLANYILSESLIDQLSYQEIYKPTLQEAYNIGRNSNGKVKNQPFVTQQYMYFPTMAGSSDAHGTLRIKYQICRPGDTSIISQSQKNTFTPFRIDMQENGKPDQDEQLGSCCCFLSNCTAQLFAPIRQINFIAQKTQSSGQMIQDQIKQINCKKSLIRFACYFLMVLSICSFFSPITTILGYIPLLGGFLKGVVGLAIFLAALIVALPLFILAVSFSWLRFHPKVGLIIFGVGLLIAGIVVFIFIKNKPENPPNETMNHFHMI